MIGTVTKGGGFVLAPGSDFRDHGIAEPRRLTCIDASGQPDPKGSGSQHSTPPLD
jgi:hypothetical protein